MAHLGWERVILLFNTEYGTFPGDLPFDFAQHRASSYSFSENEPHSKYKEVSDFLDIALKSIIEQNPKRPAELKGLSREEVQHQRDVESLRWIMSQLYIPTLQDFTSDMPKSFHHKTLHFWEGFNGTCQNQLFRLYDPYLDTRFKKLHNAWATCLKYGEYYQDTPNGPLYIFYSPMDMPLDDTRQKAWDEIDAARKDMYVTLEEILEL